MRALTFLSSDLRQPGNRRCALAIATIIISTRRTVLGGAFKVTSLAQNDRTSQVWPTPDQSCHFAPDCPINVNHFYAPRERGHALVRKNTILVGEGPGE